ncbi:MAG: arginine N-succinyltransferase [Bdellovibrionota bacterium]
MNFLLRGVQHDDLNQVLSLARQFSLLNLPYDKKIISEKIERSLASFEGDLSKADSRYVFVVEDVDQKILAGSSQILAKHGTAEEPTYSFQVIKKERFSNELGVGFIHQILRMKINEDGPTELGGLVVDRTYRSRPEKVGRIASLGRFLYIGLQLPKFEDELYAQMAPPLTEEGRSEFWESLGRRFTGMPYQEADVLSQQNKEFIRSLFPEEDIYLCLLDSKARLVMGRVGPETLPALHLLESIGFKYTHEIDPFDGGPHVGCKTKNVSLIKDGKNLKFCVKKSNTTFDNVGLVGLMRDKSFLGGVTACAVQGEEILLPEKSIRTLQLNDGESVYYTPMTKTKGRGHAKA